METLYQILGLAGAGLIIYLLYRTVKGKPEMFSKENLNKSFLTMGILAVGLIVFVGILILITRNT